MNNNEYNNQDLKTKLASKKLSMIIHHEEIQQLSKLIIEIFEEEDSQENTIEG